MFRTDEPMPPPRTRFANQLVPWRGETHLAAGPSPTDPHPDDPNPSPQLGHRSPDGLQDLEHTLVAAAQYGRVDELTRAGQVINPARGGGLVVLTGPSGIGKSSLARRLLDTLPRDLPRGFGAPLARIATPALWPWRQAARSVARSRPGGPLERLLDDLDTVPDREPTTDLAIVERVADAFVAEALRAPLALHLEDLQLFDELSLALLDTLSEPLAGVPLAVLACCRLDRATPALVVELLDALNSRPAVHVIAVPPLSEDLTTRLVTDIAGELDEQTRSLVVRLSTGNPLFAIELARAYRGGTRLGAEPASGGPTLARLVEERVRAVEQHHVLATLALLGRPATVALLSGACGVSGAQVQQVLRDAALAAMVVVSGPLGSVRFAHPLFAEAAISGLDPDVTRGLHRRLAVHVAPSGDEVAAGAVERARHLLAAGETGPQTARACLAAALYEERAGSVVTAEELAAQGLDTVGGAKPSGNWTDDEVGALRVHLLRARGRSLARDGRFAEAKALVGEAVDEARRLRNRDPFVWAVIDLTAIDPQIVAVDQARRLLLTEALGLTADNHRAKTLLLQRLADLDYLVDHDRNLQLLGRAEAAAQASGDPELVALIRERILVNGYHLGKAEELEAAAREDATGGPGLMLTLMPALSRGNRHAIETALRRVDRGHQTLPAIRGRSLVDLARLGLAVADGDAPAVQRHTIALGRYLSSDQLARAVPLIMLWHAVSGQELEMPRLTELSLPADSDLPRLLSLSTSGMAMLNGRSNERDRLRALMEPREPLLAPRRDSLRDLYTATVGLVGAAVKDTEFCSVAIERLNPYPDRFFLLSEMSVLGPVGWLLAENYRVVGRRDRALLANEQALNACRRAGYSTWIAATMLQRAAILRRSDQAQARTLAVEARAIAEARGLPPLVAIADRLFPPATSGGTPLSPAQEKVLAMAAAGWTNDQIATRLGVAVSTVEKHLSQVYRRLGVPNRAASVRWYALRNKG